VLNQKKWDVIVVGGGHAGIEASFAAAKMGTTTLLLTSNIDLFGHMACNPSVGGIGKGQLVKEIDAFGGLIGIITDQSALQFRRLNTKKGPAVHSSRAQVDKINYRNFIQKSIFNQENITILQDSIQDLIIKNNQAIGIIGNFGQEYYGKSIIITPGTFLNGLIRIGDVSFPAGRMGEGSSIQLAQRIKDLHIETARFKTGTPPRLDKTSIDFSLIEVQYGDKFPRPFSFRSDYLFYHNYHQDKCHLTFTNDKTHKIIQDNIHRAPMYSGDIEAVGVRYCPSVEDKVMKFPNHSRHHVFLEPESIFTNEIYPNGISNALPINIQQDLVRSIKGLENAIITRPGYAIEHDYIIPTELTPWLESKKISNLFLAGQINGTTGYEEAAALGLIAGINAALKVNNSDPFILKRSESYIGVMIDDLTTLGTIEPYRMFTSRVEHRLILREDNADIRLMPYSHQLGLISSDLYQNCLNKYQKIDLGIQYLNTTFITPSEKNQSVFTRLNSPLPPKKISYSELLCRPEITLDKLTKVIDYSNSPLDNLSFLELEQITIAIKYKGYIADEYKRLNTIKLSENIIIPKNFPYNRVSGLRLEEIEKLTKLMPHTLGKLSRIPGIRPVAIHIIALVLKFNGNKGLNNYTTNAPTWDHNSKEI